MLNISKYTSICEKKKMIRKVKEIDVNKEELKERFVIDEEQINMMIEGGSVNGSAYSYLPKISLEVKDLEKNYL
jgi:hypothetical protein